MLGQRGEVLGRLDVCFPCFQEGFQAARARNSKDGEAGGPARSSERYLDCLWARGN